LKVPEPAEDGLGDGLIVVDKVVVVAAVITIAEKNAESCMIL